MMNLVPVPGMEWIPIKHIPERNHLGHSLPPRGVRVKGHLCVRKVLEEACISVMCDTNLICILGL